MTPRLTPEGSQAYKEIVESFPAILQPEKAGRIDWLVGLMMAEKGVAEGDKEMVVTAARFISRPSSKARYDKMMGIGEAREVVKTGYQSLDGYYNRPRLVKRWPPIAVKPEKPPREMKVLAFCASERRGGNSDLLISEALRGAAEVGAQIMDKIYLCDINIKRCANVYMQRDIVGAWEMDPDMKFNYCEYSSGFKSMKDRGSCTLDDDMPRVYEKIKEADAIIIGFPIINGWEGEVVTSFQERWQRYTGCVITDRVGEGRRAMVIGTWGTLDIQGYDNIVEVVINRLNTFHYLVVEAISACGFAGLLSGLDEEEKGVISRYPEEMKKAYQAGRNLVTG
ncbi:MAG: flavodoxin family protein, partial [Dehalococcoidales bacterium]|nr:flavodoxin family protein [Dehalococcoidales bacterium]